MADKNVYMYHAALADLEHAAMAFARRIHVAGEMAKNVSDGDDLVAMRTLANIRKDILEAFARHPGMMQVLTGSGGL